MKWYVVDTKPRQERIAELNLRQLGVETFSPMVKQSMCVRRKRRDVLVPLFRGYMFSRFCLATHYRAVHYAQGVRRVVSFGCAPAEIDGESISFIKSRIANEFSKKGSSLFSPGQTVEINEGAFKGLEAIFEREMTAQQRVILLLDMLSHQTRVVIDNSYISAA